MVQFIRSFGNTPVPYSVAWTAEDADWRVEHCPHAGQTAICQAVAPYEGKPTFGKPHSQRQREVIAKDLCDLCGLTLRNCTKVSLSHAASRANAASAMDILQVEPLLHKACAAMSMKHCPSLKRDVFNGTLRVRQVTQHRVQFAIMDAVYTREITGQDTTAIGHAKVQLLKWRDRDVVWLMRSDKSKAAL